MREDPNPYPRLMIGRRVGPSLASTCSLPAALLLQCVGDDPGVAVTDPPDAANDKATTTDGDTPSDGQVTDGGADANTLAPSDPVALGLGLAHACVVLARGDIYCWGQNKSGE